MIHIPLAAQPALLGSVASWLVEDGLLLLSAGWSEWTGSNDGWLGSETPMWWSHADTDTYRRWLADAGLVIERETFVPEGSGGHTLVLAVR